AFIYAPRAAFKIQTCPPGPHSRDVIILKFVATAWELLCTMPACGWRSHFMPSESRSLSPPLYGDGRRFPLLRLVRWESVWQHMPQHWRLKLRAFIACRLRTFGAPCRFMPSW